MFACTYEVRYFWGYWIEEGWKDTDRMFLLSTMTWHPVPEQNAFTQTFIN